MILVGELTPYEISVWKFPDTTLCPLRSCTLAFSTRDLAIRHYKETHAKHSAMCKLCNYPLMLLKGAHHFEAHFVRSHPQEIVPPKVKDIKVEQLTEHTQRTNIILKRIFNTFLLIFFGLVSVFMV